MTYRVKGRYCRRRRLDADRIAGAQPGRERSANRSRQALPDALPFLHRRPPRSAGDAGVGAAESSATSPAWRRGRCSSSTCSTTRITSSTSCRTTIATTGRARLIGRVKPLIGEGLFTSEGDFWRRQRRLAQPAFHRQRIESLATIMSNAGARMVEDWETAAASGDAHRPHGAHVAGDSADRRPGVVRHRSDRRGGGGREEHADGAAVRLGDGVPALPQRCWRFRRRATCAFAAPARSSIASCSASSSGAAAAARRATICWR